MRDDRPYACRGGWIFSVGSHQAFREPAELGQPHQAVHEEIFAQRKASSAYARGTGPGPTAILPGNRERRWGRAHEPCATVMDSVQARGDHERRLSSRSSQRNVPATSGAAIHEGTSSLLSSLL